MPQKMTRSRPSQALLGLLSALALLAVVIGVPVALAVLGGDPLPHHIGPWSSIRDSLTQRDETGTLFIHLIVVVGWLAWASFVLSVIVETVARLRGRDAARLPGLGGPQRWAAGLIAAIALSITASAAGIAAPHAAVAAVATATPERAPLADHVGVPPRIADHQVLASATGTQAGAETSAHDAHLVYQVRKGDYLGRIAERFGEPFSDATDIAQANHIKDPNVIDIGWKITLPTEAHDTGAHHHATGHVVDGSSAQSAGDSEAPSTHGSTPRSGPSPNAPDSAHPTPHDVTPPGATASPGASATTPAPSDAEPSSTGTASPPSAIGSATPPTSSASAAGVSTPTASSSSRSPGVAADPSQASTPDATSGAASAVGQPTAHVGSGPSAAAEPPGLPPSMTAGEPGVGVVDEMLAASGTLAAVVSLAVVVMRRRDQTNQRLGRTSVMPATGGGVPRLMEPTRVEDVVRLDAALRVLSDRVADWPVEDVPQVAGVWLDHSSVTLLLADEARPAPAPFVDDPNGWRLDAEAMVGAPSDQIAPLPLLVAVGGRDRQHALLDLEYLRMLGIGGDATEAMNVLRFIVAELCHNVWADDVRVTLAGFGAEAASLSAFDPARVRVEPSVAAAVAAFHGRLADAVANLHDVRPPDVLLVAAPALGDHTALAALERDLMATPGVGMAVVIAPTPEGLPVGKYQMNVGGGGDLHIGFLGDAVMPAASLPGPLVSEVVALIAEARETGDPSPLDLARAASRTTLERVPGGRAMQFAGQRRQDPGARSFRTELEELTRGRQAHPAGLG